VITFLSSKLAQIGVAAAVVATIVASSYGLGRKHSRENWKPIVEGLQATIQATKDKAENDLKSALQEKQATEESLSKLGIETEKFYESQIATIRRERDNAVRNSFRLYDQPKTASPSNTAQSGDTGSTISNPPAASGTELSTALSRYLVEEFALADEVVAQFQSCARYARTLRAKLN
jgi:hypothetical protein